MDLIKAKRIHNLIEVLHENENFLKDLKCNNLDPEVWLRANDGVIYGVASRKSGNDYQVEGLKECLVEYFESKIERIKSQIEDL